MARKKRINIYVLMGGPSPEHEVSLNTGKMIIQNLDPKKFNVKPVLITKTGKWLIGDYARACLPIGTGVKSLQRRLAPIARAVGSPTARPSPTALRNYRTEGNPARGKTNSEDVAFIAMHGTYGEDGTIQALLELAGIPYTGSGVAASALAMNKILSSELLRSKGIAIPKFIPFDKTIWNKNQKIVISKIKKLGLPVVIKPANLGSSVGITIVKNQKEISKAVRLAFRFSSQLIAQEYISGRELTCGVIDRGIPGTEMALQPTEIIPKKSAFFDYRAKYTPGASAEITPPNLPKNVIRKIQKTAILCHRALGCSGMSRTDMILAAPRGSNSKFKIQNSKLYVLEVNTIPGMTETSLLPQGAKACGISFPKLLENIISAALNRSKNKSNIKHQNAKLQIKIQK